VRVSSGRITRKNTVKAYPRERFSSEVALSPEMLEFWVRFRRPIYADETILLEWMVVKVTPNEKLKGEIVELRGRIKGRTARRHSVRKVGSWLRITSR
jgi:hypothetical protein